MGFNQCRHTCGKAHTVDVWPKITGSMVTDGLVIHSKINASELHFRSINNRPNNDFWQVNQERFFKQISAKQPKYVKAIKEDSSAHKVHIDIYVTSNIFDLVVQVNESYRLQAHLVDNDIVVVIEADTIFGARNGLESLAQIIIFDDVIEQYMVRTNCGCP